MVDLDLDQILETAGTIVQELLATGEFGDCTFKDVLFRVDTRLELPRGTLLGYEHKNAVRERVKSLVHQASSTDDQTQTPTPPPPKKRTVRPEPGAGAKSKKRRKADTDASDQEDSGDEPKLKKAKKARPAPKLKVKETKVDKTSKRETKKSDTQSKASGKTPKPAISAEFIDSDLDLDDTDPGPSTSKPPTSSPSPKNKLKRGLIESNSEEDTTGSLRSTKHQTPPKRPKLEKISEAKDVSGDKSESEMSVLIDDGPPKRRRRSKGDKSEAKPKGTRQKKEKKELSKDEETVKRLKSLVVACGVRKVWSKEFKNLDEPSSQIKRLKSILTDLGMTGRMSIEQAKVIKAKREFAQELEDVKDFEKKVVGKSAGRSSRKKLGSGRKDVELSDEDESDSDGDEPRKKRTNARNSINAFLGDQSDED